MVKKPEKGGTVTCYKCHGEGHKFYKCPQFVKKMDKGEKKLKPIIKSSLIYTNPNRKNKTKSNTYVIKKKANGKVVVQKVGKMKEDHVGTNPLGAQGSHHQHEGASNGLGSKGHLKDLRAETWEAWHKEVVKIQA
jgi:hypothetical protein